MPADAVRGSACRVRRVESLDELGGLGPVWNEVLERSHSDTVFLTWEWLYAWSRRFLAGDRRLFVLVVTREDRTIGIAPWCLRRARFWGLPYRRIEFLGTPEMASDYLDVFARKGSEREVASAIYRHLMGSRDCWDSLHLQDVASTSLSLLHFLSLAEEEGKQVETRAGAFCPIVHLPASAEELLGQLSSNRREQYRRHRRILLRDPSVEYRTARGGESQAAIKLLQGLHRERWGTPGVEFEVLEEIAAQERARDWVEVDYLLADGRAIAGLVHLRYGGVLSMYLMALDHAYNPRISVGNVLLGMALERAIAERVRIYDFLKGTEEYKFHWSHEGRRALEVRLPAPTAATLLSTGADCCKAIGRLLFR